MANAYIPRPAARCHAWRNNLVAYVNGHLADLGLPAGDPPPSDLSFLSVDTHTPYAVGPPRPRRLQHRHYILRWASTSGEKGSWRERAVATIQV